MTIQETKKRLVEIINDSGLAIDVVDLLIENIYNIVHRQMEEAYAQLQNTQHIEEQKAEDDTKEGVTKNGSD